MTPSEVPPENTSEAESKGKTHFDLPAVFGSVGIACALAIWVLTRWLWDGRDGSWLYCISPLIIFLVGLLLLPSGLIAYGWARNRQGRLTPWQWLLLLAGIALPFAAFLAYVHRWYLYYISYKFGF
jgi:hypothetical protein